MLTAGYQTSCLFNLCIRRDVYGWNITLALNRSMCGLKVLSDFVYKHTHFKIRLASRIVLRKDKRKKLIYI